MKVHIHARIEANHDFLNALHIVTATNGKGNTPIVQLISVAKWDDNAASTSPPQRRQPRPVLLSWKSRWVSAALTDSRQVRSLLNSLVKAESVMEKLPLLPLPLLQNALGFAVPGYAEHLAPTKRTMTVSILEELAAVSTRWAAPLHEIVEQYTQSALEIVFKTASQRERKKYYRTLGERGRRATELYVCMGTIANYSASRRFSLRPSLNGIIEGIHVDWARVFASVPELKVLSLAEMPLESRHTVAALLAASTHCLKLESLTLPYVENGAEAEHVSIVLDKLYEALKSWRVAGNLGGLRHLSVPTHTAEDSFRASEEFFKNVVTNCPQVEVLDGYKMSLFTGDRLTCEDAWLLSVQDWKRFNATCTNLREFNWVVVPFADPYFRVFGEYTKPQLKKLTFGVPMNWDWHWYFHDQSEAAADIPDADWEQREYCDRPGYGYLATDVSAALKGCPLLEDLHIQLYHPTDSNILEVQIFGRADVIPDHEMIDANVFGDQFVEALVLHCPMVSRFVIEEVAEEDNTEDIVPIQTLTDQGLLALSKLRFLQSLELRSINCTGKGLLAFLNGLSDEFVGNRTLIIRIGGRPTESRLAFYDVVKELLLEITHTSLTGLSCARKKFVLRLENCSYSSRYSVTPEYSAAFMRELERLMTRVKGAHPNLRQHVVTMNRGGNNFMRIAEFGLYSAHSDAGLFCDWEDWEDIAEEEAITLANRVALVGDDVDDFGSDTYGENFGGGYYDPFDDVSDIYESPSYGDY